MSLLIVEDDKNTRKHLVSVLDLYFNKVLVATDGCEGLEKIEMFAPDVIISDIKMPYMDGIEMIKQVKNELYRPIIIFTTAFSDQKYLLDALELKVDAYLIKPINIKILLDKIEDSLDSLRVKDLRYKKLSAREYEVFLDLARGLKISEIAAKYNVKPKTISTYRNRIFEKMSFKTNAQLITYVIKNDLI